MNGQNNVNEIMNTTMEKLRGMVDANIIIGTPITVDKITLVPVSKASFGMASGGSDFSSKNGTPFFGGAGGAGVTVTPIAFIAVCGESVRMMPIYNTMNSLDKAISMTPDLIDKVKGLFQKKDPADFTDKTE